MKTNSLLLFFSLFLGCDLLADGTINETCEDFSTCGLISEGGVVYVEKNNNSTSWRVSLRNGFGEETEHWDGQGSHLGGIAYEVSEKTVYLSEGSNIRVLQSDGTPKIIDQLFFLDATLKITSDGSSDGVIFGGENGIVGIDAELNTSVLLANPAAQTFPDFRSILQSANLATDFKDSLVTVLSTNGQGGPSLLEISENAQTQRVKTDFDSSGQRTRDAFLMNEEYATCAETGATFLVNELVNGNITPDRYPLIDLGDIVSCEYDSSTDQVVLFSALNGVGFMDANGDIVRILSPTEGHHIVNGSIW